MNYLTHQLSFIYNPRLSVPARFKLVLEKNNKLTETNQNICFLSHPVFYHWTESYQDLVSPGRWLIASRQKAAKRMVSGAPLSAPGATRLERRYWGGASLLYNPPDSVLTGGGQAGSRLSLAAVLSS